MINTGQVEERLMESGASFWMVILIRGLIAFGAGIVVMVVPDMTRTWLLLPMAVTIAILVLALYGTIDSALIVSSSFLVPTRTSRMALRIQGLLGLFVSAALFSVALNHIHLHWFLLLAAIQASLSSVAELIVANHARQKILSSWNHATAILAFCFALTYFSMDAAFSRLLAPREISWLIIIYLLSLGCAECLLASRMLYATRHISIPHQA